jgi:hypothetical protein
VEAAVKKPWILAAVGVVVVGAALAFGLLRREPRPPQRPAHLPAAAEWAGRGAAGRFYLVGEREGTLFTIQVFEPGEGLQHPVKRWRMVGFARTGLIADEIAGFEEGCILLKDGSKLLPAP